MKKTLPLELNTTLHVECWTYYYMAIIEAMPNYMNWLHAHMNLYYGNMGDGLYFGTSQFPNSPEYFTDILSIEELDLYTIEPVDIVNRIKSEIDSDYYFVVFTRYDEIVHEIFVYGYDDESNSFDSILLDTTGHFVSNKVEYEYLKKGYENHVYFYKQNPNMYYQRRNFGYVMSRIKPNYKYLNKNYAAEYFDKLCNEVYGYKAAVYMSEAVDSYLPATFYYTGVTCIFKIRDDIKQLQEKEIQHLELQCMQRKLFKMLEHRQLIVQSMEWIEKQWNVNNEFIIELRETYKNHTEDMEKICFLYLKYLQNNDQSILKRIIEKLDVQYEHEKVTLGHYVIEIRRLFDREVLPSLLNQT